MFSNLFGEPKAETASRPPDWDDYWYNPYMGAEPSLATPVSPLRAMQATAVYNCVRILANTLATLPLITYRRRGDGGRDVADDAPIANLLHSKPNRWQTSVEFRDLLMTHLALRGNGYAEILGAGEPEELIPLHPDNVRVTITRYPNFIYETRKPDGGWRVIPNENMFHVRGRSEDGIIGLSPIEELRRAVSLTLTSDMYGEQYFKNGMKPAGQVNTDQPIDHKTREETRDSFQRTYGGAPNAGKTLFLSHGMKFTPIVMSNEDAQYLELRRFQVAEIARIFGIPLFMLQETDKSTSWGTGIEQQMIGFVNFTIRQWLVRWEQAIQRDLIVDEELYAEFSLAGLLRGDIASRFNAYQVGLQNGIVSRNEVRQLENFNRTEDGDEFFISNNVQPVKIALNPPEPEPAKPPATEKALAVLRASVADEVFTRNAGVLRLPASVDAGEDRGNQRTDYAPHPRWEAERGGGGGEDRESIDAKLISRWGRGSAARIRDYLAADEPAVGHERRHFNGTGGVGIPAGNG